MEYRHDPTNPLAGLSTISEDNPLQPSTHDDWPLTIDKDVFRKPFSYLQGPFLFSTKNKCRLYAEDGEKWYDIESENTDRISRRLRGFVGLVLNNPSLYGSFDRWCAAAVIKHYRILVYLNETDPGERYKEMVQDLEVHLYNSITLDLHISVEKRGEIRNLERRLTKTLMQETPLRYAAHLQNLVLLKTLWKAHDDLRYIPRPQTEAVFEQGTEIIQALARNWIDIVAPLEMLEQEGHERIQNAMREDRECLLRKVRCLMQSSLEVQRVIPEPSSPNRLY